MASNIRAAIGQQVRIVRRQRGMTQEELAGKLDRSVEAVSNIERGVSLPSLDTLFRLGEALEVPATELLEGLEGHSEINEERYRLDIELREIARSLPEKELATAVEVLRALAAKKL